VFSAVRSLSRICPQHRAACPFSGCAHLSFHGNLHHPTEVVLVLQVEVDQNLKQSLWVVLLQLMEHKLRRRNLRSRCRKVSRDEFCVQIVDRSWKWFLVSAKYARAALTGSFSKARSTNSGASDAALSSSSVALRPMSAVSSVGLSVSAIPQAVTRI